MKEKELLERMSQENFKELERIYKKKQIEKTLLREQIEVGASREQKKKLIQINEIEEGKKSLKEYDKIMVKLEDEREKINSHVRELGKVRDQRMTLIENVKDVENKVKNHELERLANERDQIAAR